MQRFTRDEAYAVKSSSESRARENGNGINKRDEIVGGYFCGNSETCSNHGFLWRKGILFNIDIPASMADSTEALGINDATVVVGLYDDNVNFNNHGFVWYRGAFATLDVPDPGTTSTEAHGISGDNDIVGFYTDAAGFEHGFLLRNGVYTYPIDYPGASNTELAAINDEGWVVGSYSIITETNQPSHAFRAKVSDPD